MLILQSPARCDRDWSYVAPRRKHLWVVRYDGLLFGSGWYTVPEPASDGTPAANTSAGEAGPSEDTATG